MTKLLAVIAATLVAIASVATGAEAAFNVRLAAPAGFNQVHKAGCGGGGGGYRRAYRKRVVRQSVRRSAPKVQTASRTIEKPAVDLGELRVVHRLSQFASIRCSRRRTDQTAASLTCRGMCASCDSRFHALP